MTWKDSKNLNKEEKRVLLEEGFQSKKENVFAIGDFSNWFHNV